MNDIINKTVQQLGIPKILIMLTISAVMIIAFTFVSSQIVKPDMQLLYGGLEPKEASQIADKLASMAIKYEVRGESNIYVPAPKVGELRLRIAGEGLVGNSIKGYEIFDKGSSFGTTSLVQNINSRRALEGELAKTIMSLPVVNNARVHLVIPKKRLFLKEQTQTTASVVVNVGSRVLQEEQINSIMHMVASSVPRLQAENVSIVDNRGKLLSYGSDQTNMAKLTNAQKYKQKVEQQYQAQLVNMLEKIVGVGKVNIQVAAEIDLNKIEETSEIYDPTTQVVRSEQSNEESSDSKGASNSGVTGTSSNLDPNSDTDSSNLNTAPTENQTKAQSTINYEISKTVRHSVKNVGKILKLSVAVVLEGSYSKDETTDKNVYVPFTDTQLGKIKSLVKSAIGYDEDRGDVIEVVDLPFSEVEQIENKKPELLSKTDIMKIIESAMILVGFIIMVLFVIKPILTTTNSVIQTKMPLSNVSEPVLRPIDTRPVPTAETEESEPTELVEVSNVQGKVREASIKKAATIIENHPNESTQVIRRWMLGDVPDSNS
ncbi:MAG: flagellar M-ring protein FliF [Proteobacteria bacterium]|nr:flagellar M-ring protein FliF [Pseudomonadota bacterium]